MAIKLELIEEGYVIWFKIEGVWETEDIAPAKEKTASIFKQADHTVHALVDLRNAKVNVPLLMASRQVIGGEALPNAGKIAVIGVSKLLRMVSEPILKMADTSGSVAFFNTIEDAVKFLKQYIPGESRQSR
jgi:hypothetical protein